MTWINPSNVITLIPTETTKPLPLDEQSWRWCRDCNSLTGGMCWRHSVRYVLIQTEIYEP